MGPLRMAVNIDASWLSSSLESNAFTKHVQHMHDECLSTDHEVAQDDFMVGSQARFGDSELDPRARSQTSSSMAFTARLELGKTLKSSNRRANLLTLDI